MSRSHQMPPMPPTAPEASGADPIRPLRRRRPWWIPPVLGRVPDVEPRHLRLLGFVSLALLFENYDFSLLTSALPFIAQSLDVPERSLGGFTGLIRLGALPAFLVIPFADRLGRRRLFLAGVVALS